MSYKLSSLLQTAAAVSVSDSNGDNADVNDSSCVLLPSLREVRQGKEKKAGGALKWSGVDLDVWGPISHVLARRLWEP